MESEQRDIIDRLLSITQLMNSAAFCLERKRFSNPDTYPAILQICNQMVEIYLKPMLDKFKERKKEVAEAFDKAKGPKNNGPQEYHFCLICGRKLRTRESEMSGICIICKRKNLQL